MHSEAAAWTSADGAGAGATVLPPCIALMGPTAAGKTAAALALAEHFPVEIISVDSAQVYRDMNIGTAKPEADVLARIPHHLIDIRDPTEVYSAAEFCRDACALIEAILQRRHLPLLVGGTMLYYRALLGGLSSLPSADPAVRERLENDARQHGWQWMHARLAQIDAVAAARIHPNDPQRIQRALEVYEITGRSLTEWFQHQPREPARSHLLKIAIAPRERAELHQRIAQRWYIMEAAGLIDEVRELRAKYSLTADMPAMRAVGYRQVWEYLDGAYDAAELAQRGIAATRQLAKRQYTWLRRESGLLWYDLSDREMTHCITIAVRGFAERHQLI